MKLTLEKAEAALGVPRGCRDEEAIRAAYKRRALVTHPDKGGNPDEFKEVGAAYAKLQRACRGEPDSDDDGGDDDDGDDGGAMDAMAMFEAIFMAGGAA